MDAACSPPEQSIRPSQRHLPPEIIEEILCNLPVKSLLQFRCVSKSWKSIISNPKFIRKHLIRAARSDHKLLIMNHYFSRFNLEKAFSSSISSVQNQPIEESNDLICPFQFDSYSRVELRAFCDELWCVEAYNSLYIWNPSMRSYGILPCQPANTCLTESVYGIGYDPIGDDYKLLIVPCAHEDGAENALYSLKTNSWRNLKGINVKLRGDGVFVNGTLHWIVDFADRTTSIISFNLSTEKYGEVQQPEYSPEPNPKDVNVVVLRGTLCVFVNYKSTKFVLWVMKEYGVEKSWTKVFDIGCSGAGTAPWIRLIPVYMYENGDVLIWVLVGNEWKLVLYKDDKTTAMEVVAGGRGKIRHVFVYVESLISPAIWAGNAPPCNNKVQEEVAFRDARPDHAELIRPMQYVRLDLAKYNEPSSDYIL